MTSSYSMSYDESQAESLDLLGGGYPLGPGRPWRAAAQIESCLRAIAALPSAKSSCSSAAYCGKPSGSRRNARESDAGGASAVSSCARRTRSRVTLAANAVPREGRVTFPLRQYVASALSAEP